MSFLLEVLGRGLLSELRAAFRDALPDPPPENHNRTRVLAQRRPDDPEALGQYATALLNRGEAEPARALFEKAAAADSTDVRWRIGLACALDCLGWTGQAVEHLRACLSTRPCDPALLFAIAYCQERIGDVDAALRGYQQSLHFQPRLRNARERLAAIFSRKGDFAAAVECYKEICVHDPTDLEATMTLANLYLKVEDLPNACRQYENAIVLDPDNWSTTDQFVDMCVQNGRIDDAIRYLEGRAAQFPERADHQVRLGDLYHRVGRPGDAQAAYDRAVALNPAFLEATIKSGTARLRMGSYRDAVTCFARAIEINDRIATAYIGLAIAHEALGDGAEAKACLEMADGVCGNSTLLFSEVARLQLQASAAAQSLQYLDSQKIARRPQGSLGERVSTLVDRQVEAIRAHLRAHPGHADLHYRLGVLLESIDDCEAAADSYRHATRVNPQYLKAQCRLALVLHRLGRFEEAVRVARLALDIDPMSVELHYQLGLLFADQRRWAEALDHFDFAVSQGPRNSQHSAHLALALQHMGLLDRAAETVRLMSELAPSDSLNASASSRR